MHLDVFLVIQQYYVMHYLGTHSCISDYITMYAVCCMLDGRHAYVHLYV